MVMVDQPAERIIETVTARDANGTRYTIERWHAAGRPAVPLITDTRGTVHATTTDLATVLRGREPQWRLFRTTAVRWVDEHC
jgi:hypothetical protein